MIGKVFIGLMAITFSAASTGNPVSTTSVSSSTVLTPRHLWIRAIPFSKLELCEKDCKTRYSPTMEPDLLVVTCLGYCVLGAGKFPEPCSRDNSGKESCGIDCGTPDMSKLVSSPGTTTPGSLETIGTLTTSTLSSGTITRRAVDTTQAPEFQSQLDECKADCAHNFDSVDAASSEYGACIDTCGLSAKTCYWSCVENELGESEECTANCGTSYSLIQARKTRSRSLTSVVEPTGTPS